MKFILLGADFSENNLGKEVLSTEISAETQALLNIYGKTWNTSEKVAINTFLTSIKAKSWYSKIDMLIMPILGQSEKISGLTASPEFTQLYDIKNSVKHMLKGNYSNGYLDGDNTVDRTGFGDNGIKILNATSSNNANANIVLNDNFRFPESRLTDMHCVVYGKVCMSKFSIRLNPYITSVSQANWQAGASDKVSRALFNPALTDGWYFIGGSRDSVNEECYGNTNGSQRTGTYNSEVYDTAVGSSFYLGVDSATYGQEISLMSFGAPLTESELVEYNTLVQALMSVIIK